MTPDPQINYALSAPDPGDAWILLFEWVAVNEQRREHDLPIIERMWR